MNYIVNPMELVSPFDNCTCENNSGTITYSNPCGSKCTNYCGTFEVCVTPTGVKYSPEGINPKA